MTGPYVLFMSPAAYKACVAEMGSHEAIEAWYQSHYGVKTEVRVTRPIPVGPSHKGI